MAIEDKRGYVKIFWGKQETGEGLKISVNVDEKLPYHEKKERVVPSTLSSTVLVSESTDKAIKILEKITETKKQMKKRTKEEKLKEKERRKEEKLKRKVEKKEQKKNEKEQKSQKKAMKKENKIKEKKHKQLVKSESRRIKKVLAENGFTLIENEKTRERIWRSISSFFPSRNDKN